MKLIFSTYLTLFHSMEQTWFILDETELEV